MFVGVPSNKTKLVPLFFRPPSVDKPELATSVELFILSRRKSETFRPSKISHED